MGVPDFLKFVARSAPGALCRIPALSDAPPANGSADPSTSSATAAALLQYDYVLVDATNAAQTIGLDRLQAFLCDPRLVVRRAIVLAVDAGRTREGTARHYRQTHLMIGDLDVRVQQLCALVAERYRQRAVAQRQQQQQGRGGAGAHPPSLPVEVPYVVMSGRGVAGEADYKVLDLQRMITATALAGREKVLPRFLFISEDSDILCGALCGPCPQNVSIATNLRDTMFELGILRLEHVLAYVAVCVDALADGTANEEAAAAAAPTGGDAGPVAGERLGGPAAPAPDAGAREECVVDEEEGVHSGRAKAAEVDVVRRRKQDGPMVAAGKRVTLSDSSDDDDDEAGPTGVRDGQVGKLATGSRGATASAADASTAIPTAPTAADLTPFRLAAGSMIHGSCVDLVFLFIIVMGNGMNVPPLVRGATKVDIASCWQAYCRRKFASTGAPLTLEEREQGRTLLAQSAPERSRGSGKGDDHARAALVLDARFLLDILEAVHYADALSRPPVEEEKNRALAYLASAAYATLRYVVACNVGAGGTAELRESFLDSRPLAETEVATPSLAAVVWVLSQEDRPRFHFPLHGLARRELTGGRTPTVADATGAGSTQTPGAAAKAAASALELNVANALVLPPSAVAASASWAMARGGGGAAGGVARSLTLSYMLAHPNTATAAATRATPMRSGAGPVGSRGGGREGEGRSVAALTRAYAGLPDTFAALCETWRRSIALAVPRLQSVAARARFMSPVTGNIVEGPAAAADGAASPALSGVTTESASNLVYSFELRRMTPLLSSGEGDTPAADTGNRSRDRESGSAVPSSSDNAVQAALAAALGLSFSYTAAPPVPQGVVLDSEVVTKAVNPLKRRREKSMVEGRDRKAATHGKPMETKADADAEADASEAKPKYRRPGKKERMRRQQEKLPVAEGKGKKLPS